MADLTKEELAMDADKDVRGHIERCNAARHAQAKAEGWGFYTTTAVEIADSYGSVYQFELAMARATYSDAYKDRYGIRPRGTLRGLTLREVEAKLAALRH